jgi:hypothetical protein
VKCFICEPYALAGAAEITRFGGWRAYLANAPLQSRDVQSRDLSLDR